MNILYAQQPHRSWNDLDEGEHELFGSEKEEKYTVQSPVMEVEKWENHYSTSCLGLKYIDYPKYKSTSCLFYYSIKSKVDNRSYTSCMPLIENEIDGDYYYRSCLRFAFVSMGDRDYYKKSSCCLLSTWGGSYKDNNSFQIVLPLLLYHSADHSADSGKSLWVNPLFVSKSHWTGGKEDRYLWWMPFIPLTYHSVDTIGGHRNFLWLLDYSWITVYGRESLERFWLLPLYMWRAGSDGYTSIVPPVYILNKYANGDYYTHVFPLFAAWKETDTDTSVQVITPLFGRRKVIENGTGKELYSNFFFPLLPLFFRSNDSIEGTHTNIAWLVDFTNNREGSLKTFWLVPLAFLEFKDYGYRINPLYYLHESSGVDGGSYTFFAPVIPLYYYGETTVTGENGLELKENISVSPFHMYLKKTTVENPESTDSSTLMLPILPVFYRNTEGNYTHWNLLGMIDRCTDTDYSRFFIFPLFYASQKRDVRYRNILGIIDWETGDESGGSSMFLPFYMWHGGEESSLALPLLLTYFSSGKDRNSGFIAGIYWYADPGYEHRNILMLYDHTMYREGTYVSNEYDFLFSLAEFDISPEVRKMRLAWGALISYTKGRTLESFHYDALFWLAGSDNDDGGFHSRILPLWYYQSLQDKSWELYVPPILSYFSKERSGRYDSVLLGALYYRNENIYSGTDRRMVLMGILWNEVKRPEREYKSRGSLWVLSCHQRRSRQLYPIHPGYLLYQYQFLYI